jgi:hypothetical protein
MLWDLPAMEDAKPLAQPGPESKLIRRVGPIEFAPLVARQTNLFASLEVIMLRPEPDGKTPLRTRCTSLSRRSCVLQG